MRKRVQRVEHRRGLGWLRRPRVIYLIIHHTPMNPPFILAAFNKAKDAEKSINIYEQINAVRGYQGQFEVYPIRLNVPLRNTKNMIPTRIMWV